MMRKTSLILLGAAAGVAATLVATQPRLLDGARAQAAAADTYRQLSLFGDVFERVRADYVEKPHDSKLIKPASTGCWRGSTPIPATWIPRASATCRCRLAASSAGSASKSPWKKG